MTKIIFIINPTISKEDISLKSGMMYLNRFFIDEDAAFELSGVYTWDKTTGVISNDKWPPTSSNDELDFHKPKGKRLHPYFLTQ